MNLLRVLLCSISFGPVLVGTALAVEPAPQPAPAEVEADDAANEQLLVEGVALLKARRAQEAISGPIDKVIAAYDEKYRGSTRTIYCARSTAEMLIYLLEASATKKDAVTLKPTWATALYLKAYALVDLGRAGEAKLALARALELSPRNSQFLSERAQIAVGDRDWAQALATFRLAAEAADVSPAEAKNRELARAWRGMAYVDVEQGELAEAEALYRRCLALDPDDRAAAGELQYVTSLRARRGS